MANRKIIIVVGAMRSGKSFFCNEYLREYIEAGGCGIVYNLGKNTDFEAAEQATLYSGGEHEECLGKEQWDGSFDLYTPGVATVKKPLQFKKFNIEHVGKAFKCYRIADRATERAFVKSFYRYCSNTLLILDDTVPVFRHGINEEFYTLFSRINHSGERHLAANWKSAGADIILIYHSLNHIREDMFDFVTDIVCFKYEMEPDWKVIKNDSIRNKLKESFKFLSSAPQYSLTWLNINELELKKMKKQ